MIGIDWMPDDPVPITATRLPVKSTGSCGQCGGVVHLAGKGIQAAEIGVIAADNAPVAIRQNRAVSLRPPSVVTVQRSVVSSSTAETTRVLNVMSRRRSSRSATQFR